MKPITYILLKVPHDLVPIVNRLQVRRRRMEKGLEIVFITAGGDRGHDLIEIEVHEEVRRLNLVGKLRLEIRLVEDAAERHINLLLRSEASVADVLP